MLIYKALLKKNARLLCSLLTFKYSIYHVRSHDFLTLAGPLIQSELAQILCCLQMG